LGREVQFEGIVGIDHIEILQYNREIEVHFFGNHDFQRRSGRASKHRGQNPFKRNLQPQGEPVQNGDDDLPGRQFTSSIYVKNKKLSLGGVVIKGRPRFRPAVKLLLIFISSFNIISQWGHIYTAIN
jgi:hypothetical protein